MGITRKTGLAGVPAITATAAAAQAVVFTPDADIKVKTVIQIGHAHGARRRRNN